MSTTIDGKSPVPPAFRSVAAGRGLDWVTEGWALFLRAPGPWVVMVLLFLVITLICNAIPVLGGLLGTVASAVLSAGALICARNLQQSGTMQVGELFSIFQHPALKPVLIVAGIYVGLALLAAMAFGAVVIGAGGAGMLMGAMQGDGAALAGGVFGLLLGALVMVALMAPITAMYWFAIPAVVFQGTEPWTAMKQSLSACLANMMPMLVYGVIALVALTLGSIPFFLGLLVVAPVLVASWLVSYQDIFGIGTGTEVGTGGGPISPA